MKGFKKLLTGILAATMIMGASITAMATDAQTTATTSITITNENNNSGEVAKITYDYYQILKADVKNVSNDGAFQTGTAAYYVESETLADLLTKTGLFTVTKSADNSRWNVELTDSKTTASDIVEKLNTEEFKKAASAHGTFDNLGADNKATKTATVSVEPGYYLVLSSLGTKAALQTLGNVTINEKNEYPTVTKDEDRKVDSMFDTKTPINYTVTVKIPASVENKDIVVYDKATVGLTINPAVTATVDGAALTGTYAWSVSETTDTHVIYSLTIDKAVVTANAGKTIVLVYTGTPNEKAVVLVPEKNTAYIKYDNYTSAETKEVTVVTLGFNILKVDGVDKKPLTGAEFTLWDAEKDGNEIKLVWDAKANAYRVANAEEAANGVNVAVDENGEATIIGLDAKQYYLQEEVAPTGYNLLTVRKPVTVSETTELQTITVENNSGSVLPSTGGIGTTIFYIFGGVLILAGVAYFILRRKALAE
nr:SpaA isopeptide-forming pilin-related protein [uncultured Butyrivibrio sp.]